MERDNRSPAGSRMLEVGLAVYDGDHELSWTPLGTRPLTVGRDESRDIVVPDGLVSRLHLKVELVAGRVVVEDLGSGNGTFLAGRRVHGTFVLVEGAAAEIGHHQLRHERRPVPPHEKSTARSPSV